MFFVSVVTHLKTHSTCLYVFKVIIIWLDESTYALCFVFSVPILQSRAVLDSLTYDNDKMRAVISLRSLD